MERIMFASGDGCHCKELLESGKFVKKVSDPEDANCPIFIAHTPTVNRIWLLTPKPNNMKQATVKLSSGEYLIAELPAGIAYAGQVHIYAGEDPVTLHNKDGEIISAISFPGSWQLLGADPTALTEVEAGEIVEGYSLDKWRNYKASSQYEELLYKLPTASLDSLAASLGISKPYVILKNVEK